MFIANLKPALIRINSEIRNFRLGYRIGFQLKLKGYSQSSINKADLYLHATNPDLIIVILPSGISFNYSKSTKTLHHAFYI